MNIRPLHFLTVLIALLAAPLFAQEEADDLYGLIDENNHYTNPGGQYRIVIPVLAELNGTVNDTPAIATFRDPYGVHVVVACLPFEPELRTELTTRGRKDFLSWFYSRHIQTSYQQSFPGTTAESARYLPSVQDGSLLVMSLIPNGTAFADRVFIREGETPPVAKRGSLVFIKNDYIFIVTTELYERILKRDTFKKTTEEEDAILRGRLMDILGKMTFRDAPATSATSSTPAAAATPAPTAPAVPVPAAK
jgi:hypothetical protein